MSAKLKRIAREYRIDPDSLPPVNDPSVTFKYSETGSVPAPVVVDRQTEFERLKANMREARRQLDDFIRRDKAERQKLR